MTVQKKSPKEENAAYQRRIIVWDLPTRLFHWLTVIFTIVSFTTGMVGGNWMTYHLWSGYVVLTLILFRLAWGFWGGRYSRFVSFVRGPDAVWRYAKTLLRQDAPKHLGHNPMGGWSVMAMLAALLIQAGTGMFANDNIATQGPLYQWVGKTVSDWLTGIHLLNKSILLFLIAMHLAAVFFYLVAKGENLIAPMITGYYHGNADGPSSFYKIWRALLIAALSAAAVYGLIY